VFLIVVMAALIVAQQVIAQALGAPSEFI